MNGWMVLIAAAVLIFMTVASMIFYRDAQLLATQGATVTGEVRGKYTKQTGDSDKYILSFRFVVDANRYDADRTVRRSVYNKFTQGDKVDITYWTKDPRKFEFMRGQTRRNAQGKQFFALIAGVVALGLLWRFGSRTNRAVLARRHGVRTTATISNIVERMNSGQRTGFGYMIFRTQDDKRGESLDHPMDKLRALQSGADIVVFQRGEDVWWEGDVGPRPTTTTLLPKVPLPPDE